MLRRLIKRAAFYCGYEIRKIARTPQLTPTTESYCFETSAAKKHLTEFRPLFRTYFDLSSRKIAGTEFNAEQLADVQSEVRSVFKDLESMEFSGTDCLVIDYVKSIFDSFNTVEVTYIFQRYRDYISQLGLDRPSTRRTVWEIGANRGELSLLLKALGHEVIPSDEITPIRKSKFYGFGSADWIREECFGFTFSPNFSCTHTNVQLLAEFDELVSFDVITVNATGSVYSAGQTDEQLISYLGSFAKLLKSKGVFQSRSDSWYYEIDSDTERSEKLERIAKRLEHERGVKVIDAGIDRFPVAPGNTVHPEFNMQLVFQKP